MTSEKTKLITYQHFGACLFLVYNAIPTQSICSIYDTSLFLVYNAIPSRDCRRANTWLVLDGVVSAAWSVALLPVLREGGAVLTLAGTTVRPDPSVRIILETCDSDKVSYGASGRKLTKCRGSYPIG